MNLIDFLKNIPSEFAIVEELDGRLRFMIGPFHRQNHRTDGSEVIYLNDFYLSSPEPYLSFQDNFSIKSKDRCLANQLSEEHLAWQISSKSEFSESFFLFKELLNSGSIKKAVPVVFQIAEIDNLDKFLPALLNRLIIGKAGLLSYAIRTSEFLMIGASPEILFNLDRTTNIIQTEAVAGSILGPSAPLKQITEKLLEEHRLVVDDLVSQLSVFGTPRVEDVRLKNLSSLCHLRSAIELEAEIIPSAENLIDLLHPSGALGILPRLSLKDPIYKNLDYQKLRTKFGSPFGLIKADGSAQIIVAIRNLIYENKILKVGAGVGLTAKSELESEWLEVLGKQASVKDFFSLNPPT